MQLKLDSYRLSARDNRERMAAGLGWLSIGLGLAELLAPGALCRMMGVEPRRKLARILGLREIASGIGLLTQADKRPWLKSRVVGDAMDLGLMGTAFLDDKTKAGRLGVAMVAVAGVAAVDLLCSNEYECEAGMRPPEPGNARGAVFVRRSLIIERPPEQLYSLWRNLHELPRFMRHVTAVKETSPGRYHWLIKGPGGLQVEWDAEIVEERPNEFISWRSLPYADVDHAGSVRFEKAVGNRGTIVRVELRYRPPGGKVGAKLAQLLGQGPEHQIAGDLLRFKQLVETGEIARTEGQPAGRERSTSRKYDDLVRA